MHPSMHVIICYISSDLALFSAGSGSAHCRSGQSEPALPDPDFSALPDLPVVNLRLSLPPVVVTQVTEEQTGGGGLVPDSLLPRATPACVHPSVAC